jgi:hypothetical protein
VYLLWPFGFVLFCSSRGDAVARYLIPHARRIADAPLDAVPQISWGNSVLVSAYRGPCSGVLKGRAAKPILLGCPLLLQLWCHKLGRGGPAPRRHGMRGCRRTWTVGLLHWRTWSRRSGPLTTWHGRRTSSGTPRGLGCV